jgi:hypothetical protein
MLPGVPGGYNCTMYHTRCVHVQVFVENWYWSTPVQGKVYSWSTVQTVQHCTVVRGVWYTHSGFVFLDFGFQEMTQ